MSLRVERNEQDERLWARLHSAGLHLTENRRIIMAVFLSATEPVTVIDLWLRTKKADPGISYGTVWRLLDALVHCGLAHRESSPADGIYRYRSLKVECTHERITCKDCGATVSSEGGQHDHVENAEKGQKNESTPGQLPDIGVGSAFNHKETETTHGTTIEAKRWK
jgi:Fe2+ or Zn2+ uptake regulation protein